MKLGVIVTRNKDEEVFDDFNRTYFGGRLPSFRVIRVESSVHGRHGTLAAVAQCEPRKRLIRLSDTLSGESLHQILLHEMCHIETSNRPGYDHGKAFRSKLRQLQRQGEDWARDEIEYYKLAEIELGFRKRLRSKVAKEIVDIVDNLLICNDLDVSWVKIRHYLSNELGLNAKDFPSRFPWVKEYWQFKIAQDRWGEAKRGDLLKIAQSENAGA